MKKNELGQLFDLIRIVFSMIYAIQIGIFIVYSMHSRKFTLEPANLSAKFRLIIELN